jgi:hypothetical protein
VGCRESRKRGAIRQAPSGSSFDSAFEAQCAFAVIEVLVGGEGSVNALYFPQAITLDYA